MSTRRENMHKCTYFLFIFQTSSVFRMEPQPQFTAHKAHSLWKSSTTGTLVHVTFAAQRSLPRNFSLQEIGNQKTHTYRYCTSGNLKRRRCSVKCRFTKQKVWIFFFFINRCFLLQGSLLSAAGKQCPGRNTFEMGHNNLSSPQVLFVFVLFFLDHILVSQHALLLLPYTFVFAVLLLWLVLTPYQIYHRSYLRSSPITGHQPNAEGDSPFGIFFTSNFFAQ